MGRGHRERMRFVGSPVRIADQGLRARHMTVLICNVPENSAVGYLFA